MYLHLDIPLRHRNSLLAAAAAAAAVAVAVGNILLVAHLVGFAVGSILFGGMNIAAVEQGCGHHASRLILHHTLTWISGCTRVGITTHVSRAVCIVLPMIRCRPRICNRYHASSSGRQPISCIVMLLFLPSTIIAIIIIVTPFFVLRLRRSPRAVHLCTTSSLPISFLVGC